MRRIKKVCTKCKGETSFGVFSKEQIKQSLASMGWISRPGLTLCYFCVADKKAQEEEEWRKLGPHTDYGHFCYCPKYQCTADIKEGQCRLCNRTIATDRPPQSTDTHSRS